MQNGTIVRNPLLEDDTDDGPQGSHAHIRQNPRAKEGWKHTGALKTKHSAHKRKYTNNREQNGIERKQT